MKITVVGTGYVGLVAGLCFADFGHKVICLDVDKEKIDKLSKAICPLYEPGAEFLLQKHLQRGTIEFTMDVERAISFGEAIFIAVGTPETPSGEADMRYVHGVAQNIGRYMTEYKLVVDKSTVPVGTSREVESIIRKQLLSRGLDIDFDVASNPEFLREGKAIGDFTNPDRIVVGVTSEKASDMLRKIYNVFTRSGKPFMVVSPETAEMIKYASNAFLATKITFVNEIANLCEKVGADALAVAAAMGKDGRISSKFLHPGPGYGGSCFPKDTKALCDTGRKYGSPMTVVESVIAANARQKELSAQKIISSVPKGTIAILGLSFKPATDDIRESPALTIIERLMETKNYQLRLFDPEAMTNAMSYFGDVEGLVWCNSTEEAVTGADAIAIVTEWGIFRTLDLDAIKKLMKGNIVFDFRNAISRQIWTDAGFVCHGTGV